MKKGFTLAEVLITLGIIGIVAAMTLPSILANQREKVVETRLAKFYSIMNQAISRSEVDNGPKEYWEFPSTELSNLDWYNKYLSKYIKTLKVEESSINTASRNAINIHFVDGSAVIFGDSWLFYPDAKKNRS